MRTLVNLDNHPQTDKIIRLLGEACNKLTREAQSRLVEEETVDFTPHVHSQRYGRTAFEEVYLFPSTYERLKIPTIVLLFGVSARRMKMYGPSVSGYNVGTAFVFID